MQERLNVNRKERLDAMMKLKMFVIAIVMVIVTHFSSFRAHVIVVLYVSKLGSISATVIPHTTTTNAKLIGEGVPLNK